MATGYNNYRNPNTTPIAEIIYDLPADGATIYDMIPNPIVTIVYADGSRNVFDTNAIFKRGMKLGEERAKSAMRVKLGLN